MSWGNPSGSELFGRPVFPEILRENVFTPGPRAGVLTMPEPSFNNVRTGHIIGIGMFNTNFDYLTQGDVPSPGAPYPYLPYSVLGRGNKIKTLNGA